MFRISSVGIALLVPLILVGCSSAKLYNQHFAQNYRFLELMDNHGGKDMRLEVLGNPYGADPADLAETAAAAMRGRNQGLPIAFTPTPVETEGAPTRMVLLLGPEPDALPQRVCQGAAAPDTNADGRSAMLVYCKRQTALSGTWIDFPDGAAPGGKPFAEALALAVHTLTPPVSPFDKPERCGDDC